METRRNKQIFCFPTFLWVDVYFQLKTTERESEEKTESWMRGQQTCPLTIHFNMWTVSSDVTKAPLAAALSPFMSLLYPPNPRCEWCDVWRLATPPGSTSPTLFEHWWGFFYVPLNQTSVSAVRRDLRFFVLIGKVKRSEEFSFTWENSSPSEGYFSVALQYMATVSLFSYMNMHDDRREIIRLKTILYNTIWFWI